jgi:pimeloyl-ACP methyl ester carboxylesterase
MKHLLKIVLGILIVLGVGFLFLRTPDTDIEKMKAKYGGELAHYTDQNGLAVHYRDQGNPDGQPILFIHGSNASLHTWEQLIAGMPKNYRLISLDLPGHGLTGPHPQDDYSAEAMFEAVEAVASELNLDDQQLILVGNSMGGWVSWRYALDHPDRVKAMVLIDAAGAPTTTKPPLNLGFKLMRNPLIRPLTTYITPRSIIKKSLQQTIDDDALVTEEMVDRYWELLRYPGNRHATGLRAIQSRETEQYGKRLNEIATPSLILWGETDQLIYVSSAHIFNETLQDSSLIIYPDIGHIPMEENAADVARDIIAFLDKAEVE